ncbi:putative lipid II flippase FtsW [Candidatus Poribacteria bacterium]|nr:putative lipid II flippase FtsW [Candidatus Poribacteria bacterium]
MDDVLLRSPAKLIAIVTAALVTLGIVMVYSASGARAGLETRRAVAVQAELPQEHFEFHHSPAYVVRQVVWTAGGLILLLALMKTPIEKIERVSPYVLLGCLAVLLVVLVTPLGVTSKGARRWLQIGPITLQPSEFAKIALVIFMARFLAEKRDDIREWKKGFLPTVSIWGVFAVLIVLERDLGTIIVMGTVMLGMWCLARVRFSHLATLGVASLPVLVYLLFQHSYRINRILAVLDPSRYALTHGYQLNQSLIAVGSGGLWGRGLGLGLQKYHFLSEAHTDFIFAIVCEELGLIGALSIVLLFLAFTLIGFRVSYKAPDYFGGLVAAGLTLTISCAAFINFFVVLGMAPTKGLALPFFTYGGSSMVATLMAVGILLNVSNYTTVNRGGA